MVEEARNQGKAKDMFYALPVALEPVGLWTIQRFLAPLNNAAQCFTKRGEIEQFCEVLTQIVQDIDKTAAQLEADLAEGALDAGSIKENRYSSDAYRRSH